jgi:tetratricopeptide (TPR) repeat protein
MSLSSFPHPLFAALGNWPAELVVGLGVLLVASLAGGGVGAWRLYGKGPRRQRLYKAARELVQKGDWQAAQNLTQQLVDLGHPTPEWEGRINNLEGECLRAAGEAALADRKFEEAFNFHKQAAQLLGLNQAEAHNRILDGMLAEVRRGVAAGADDKAAKLAARVLQLETPSPEASFWIGFLHLHGNRTDQAHLALRTAYETGERKAVDPTLYLGMLLLREGKTKDGLRYLADANRMAPNSPLVGWQLGAGLVAAGGDAALAARALQRAAGPDGLPKLAKEPKTFWAEALPDSYIAKLAKQHEFRCPMLGDNVAMMARQAKLALGQALFRQDRAADAVAVFQDILNEAEPTVALLRWLGIALCKLERYDEAYPHLKAAHEQETSKNPLTACYLAHAASQAKPSRPEDRPANVRWAVRLLVDLAVPVEMEPALMVAGVFAEARKLGVPVPVEDQLRLCDTLVALGATSAVAAAAFDHLATSMPDAVRPPYAFLYARAALTTGYAGERDLELLSRVFRQREAAREYYQSRNWNLDEIEELFLERWTEQRSGFPDVFGPDYPERCEQRLIQQAKEFEAVGESAKAKATIDLLRHLLPPTAVNLDRLAKLAWHRGEVDEAVRLLSEWGAQAADHPTPRLRLAVVEQARNNGDAATRYVRDAVAMSQGPVRAHAAFVGAKLAVRGGRTDEAISLCQECLEAEAAHADARWLLAALRWKAGDRAGVAALAPSMDRPDVTDPRFAYLAAVCQMEGGNVDAAPRSARAAAVDGPLQADGHHLLAQLHMSRGDWSGAEARLEAALPSAAGPTADHARALLGRVFWEQRSVPEAADLWGALPAEKRKAWGIDTALPGVSYIAGLQALRMSDHAGAAEWLGRARDLGLREPRLPVLHERALVQAARRQLDGDTTADLDALIPMLDKASKSRGPQQLLASLLLSRIYRRQNKLPEAADAARRPGPAATPALMQIGLIAIQDRQLTQAEEAFARVLQEEPGNAAAAINLFWTRLSLGQTAAAAEQIPGILDQTTDPERRALLSQLLALLRGGPAVSAAMGDMTAEEEQRLIETLRNLGRLETTVPLLCQLAAARTASKEAKEAQTTGMLRLGKQRFDRGDWLGAEKWLSPLAKARPTAAVRNLLGVLACLTQDYAGGILHLQEALRLAGDDPRMHQNLALAFTWQGDVSEAALCWGRYLGTMSRNLPRPPGFIDYFDQLRFQTLRYLGNQEYEHERWTEALAYVEEAHGFRPDNTDLTERLFLLQIQAGRRSDARKTLTHLKGLKPKHPPFELYELDLIDVRSAHDVEMLLDTLGRLIDSMPNDPATQEKAVVRVTPLLQQRADDLTKQMRDIREDLRRLFEDSPGWWDALRDLRGVKRDLKRLRQITRYCASLPVAESHRRRLDDLTEELERKIDYCRRWEDDY